MYKTVDFNIFEEHLEEIVYGKEADSRRSEYRTANRTVEFTVQTVGEIVVKPLTETTRNLKKEEK
jgi:hypothetical protein